MVNKKKNKYLHNHSFHFAQFIHFQRKNTSFCSHNLFKIKVFSLTMTIVVTSQLCFTLHVVNRWRKSANWSWSITEIAKKKKRNQVQWSVFLTFCFNVFWIHDQSAADRLQQRVPKLAQLLLCYTGLESKMTARTSKRQMVPNVASVSGLTTKTFHPFVYPPLSVSSDLFHQNSIVKVIVIRLCLIVSFV